MLKSKKIIKAFTLIELLVTISIIGVLATLVITNINEARARARDVRKKEDMYQLKTALKLYYNDYSKYPGKCGINTIAGCGADAKTCCDGTICTGFAAGGTGCDTVYMNKLPDGLGSNTVAYNYNTSNDTYCIKTVLENKSDPDISSSYTACNSICKAIFSKDLASTEYAVCSD